MDRICYLEPLSKIHFHFLIYVFLVKLKHDQNHISVSDTGTALIEFYINLSLSYKGTKKTCLLHF